MPEERFPSQPADPGHPIAGTQARSGVQDCVDALMVAFQNQLDLILQRARSREEQFAKALEEVTLLTRKEAAERMHISLASLDRLVLRKEISATYVDDRPRFRLGEIVRFLEARTVSPGRKLRR